MKCFSKIEITRCLWGRDYFYDAHTIESHVSRLRRKLDAHERESSWITTVRRAGYRLEGQAGIDVLVSGLSTAASADGIAFIRA